MINKRKKKFCTELAISSPPMFAQFVKPYSARPKAWLAQVDRKNDSMIHVCFSLHDKTGAYSKFTGTAMLSLFENVNNTPHLPSITVHLLHDNTLTDDNRDKLIQIVDRYGQLIKFYNVEELFTEKLAEINRYFLNVNVPRYSIAMFYRFFIPRLLLPQGIEKAIYLDADIIVNLDIMELWQVEMKNHPLAVVTEIASGVEIGKYSHLIRDGFAKEEDYFNSGILLMNLKILRNEEDTILAGIKFRSEHSEYNMFDQEILNYCFSVSSLKLPVKFNHLVKQMRMDKLFSIKKEIYHYAGNKIGLGPNMNDPFNHLWMSYFIKTPWFGVDTAATFTRISLPSPKNHSISVVIPLYNAEKYLSACLDSLLVQTFQDFEVIIVDDCSTDSSYEIVKSYVPKFNGRLKFCRLKTNSGSGGVPRTKAITLSRGEYVFFLDADDMLKNTALKTMYSLAKDYDADVVYFEKHYYSDENGTNIRLFSTKGLSIKKPTFEPQDLKERVDRVIKGYYTHVPWLNLVRRDLMIENEVFFPKIHPSEDIVWLYALVFYAKKFLRVPNAVYIYRPSEDSMMRKKRTPQETVIFRVNPLLDGLKIFDKLLGRHEFFKENPDCRYTLLKMFVNNEVTKSLKAAQEITDNEIYSIIKNEYGDKLGEHDVLISALFTALYTEKKQNILLKFKDFLTARIDIKFLSTKGNFKIIYMSDDKANISNPTWIQKDGIGYVIKSLNGVLTLIAKATVDGQLNLQLKGIWVPNPADKTKPIPYWIDYTKLVVNDKTIFNKRTPVWHDKPFRCNINAKADEEITVKVEWQPHRSDFIEQKVLPPPPKIEPIPDKFRNYLTARIDINLLTTEGDLKIISSSDSKAKISQPSFMKEERIGYIITSLAGSLTLVAKATVDGQLNLKLRGMYIPASENESKAIPYWIDYTALTVNDETIVDTLTPAWHDKPYIYNTEVKADEEITVKVDWLPHMGDFIEQKVLLPPPPKVEPIPDKFRNYLTARIDINLLTTKGDFKIISSSDSKAKISQPSFMKEERIGYIVTSFAGSLTLVAKASVDGQLNLKLRGVYVSEGKSKAIPYWIDYTALTVNDETILDTLTPAWHDKPYIYNMAVKADEEIIIKIEWLPHRGKTKK